MAGYNQISKENWEVNFRCKDYLGNNIRIRKRGFKTKKLAKEYADDYIAKMSGTSDILFATAFQEFLEYKSKTIKKRTYNTFKTRSNKHILPYFKNLKLNTIDEKIVAKFYLSLSTQIIYTECKSALNLFFNYAKIHFGIKYNPTNIKVELPYTKKKTGTIWTLEEFRIFDELLKSETLKFRVYFNLLYFSGARAGEICALTIKDINFDTNSISINKTRISKNETNEPKTKSSVRQITIPISVMKMLKEYIDKYPVIPEMLFSTYFIYTRKLTSMIKKNNLKKITLHDFRHSHASFLIKNGMDIASISKRLGHANVGITLSTYTHFYDNKKDDILEFLNTI